MKEDKTLIILNTFGLILMLVLNGLAVALPLNGQTTKELSDMYPKLLVIMLFVLVKKRFVRAV